MDMSIQMKTESGAICTLSLSFNNDGPLGTFFRYICDNGTYIARYDDLYDGRENQIDLSDVAVSNNGIELIDREFISAIQEGREPNGSVAQVLPAMETLDRIERRYGAESIEDVLALAPMQRGLMCSTGEHAATQSFQAWALSLTMIRR